jgi:hypothetical protein
MDKLDTACSVNVVTEVEIDYENFWIFREKWGERKSQFMSA